MYALTTHTSALSVNPRLPWIDGSATFTIVVSSTIMSSPAHSMYKASHFFRSSTNSALQGSRQPVHERAGAALAAAGVVVPVEESALLGHGHLRAALAADPGRLEHDRRERDRDLLLVDVHRVGVEDPALRHDVEIARVEVGDAAALPAPRQPLAAVDAEVHLAPDRGPLVRGRGEPGRLGRGVGPSGVHALRRVRQLASDGKRSVDGAHLFLGEEIGRAS